MSGYPHANPSLIVTEGAVCGRWFFQDIAVDGSVIPGMSGGPVFNLQGEVIGLNTATTTGPGRHLGLFLPMTDIMQEMIEHDLR